MEADARFAAVEAIGIAVRTGAQRPVSIQRAALSAGQVQEGGTKDTG